MYIEIINIHKKDVTETEFHRRSVFISKLVILKMCCFFITELF